MAPDADVIAFTRQSDLHVPARKLKNAPDPWLGQKPARIDKKPPGGFPPGGVTVLFVVRPGQLPASWLTELAVFSGVTMADNTLLNWV